MIEVCIEVEAGSRNKHRYDEMALEYKGTHRISQPYPYPYGFILGTSAEDGDGVDCYIITHDRLLPGTIVDCEPIGLLVQDESGEVDHKVLAAMPGQNVELGPGVLRELQDFIYTIFTQYPEISVSVGPILPRAAALLHIQECREA